MVTGSQQRVTKDEIAGKRGSSLHSSRGCGMKDGIDGIGNALNGMGAEQSEPKKRTTACGILRAGTPITRASVPQGSRMVTVASPVSALKIFDTCLPPSKYMSAAAAVGTI